MTVRFRAVLAAVSLTLVAAVVTGCDSAAVVKVQLKNETQAQSAAPSRFAVRLRRVYLTEGVDAQTQVNVGKTAVVWQNIACAGGGAGAVNSNDCPFVDLASKSEALNATLDSQPVLTHAGTYNFVRLEICQSQPTEANIEWSGGAMNAPKQATHDWCALTSAPVDPPVHLEVGESATIALSYDLSSTVESGPALTFPTERNTFFDCTTDVSGGTRSCARMPMIVAKVSKAQ